MKKRLLILFVCLFCLSGCSTKLAYNFLGVIFKWYISSYVSLEGQQKSFVEENINDFHQWHRNTQLKVYAGYIDKLIKRLENEKISGDWIHKETDELQLMLDSSVTYLKPGLTDLMASFTEKQTDEVIEKFAKKRKEFSKKYVEVEEKKLRKKRMNEILDNISPFFGSYTKEQKKWIESWGDNLKPYEALSLKQQETWAAKVEDAFKSRQDKAELAKKLDTIVFYRTDDWDPELQAILDHNQEITYELFAKLVNSQTEKQRARMFKKLRNYRDDFIALSEKQ